MDPHFINETSRRLIRIEEKLEDLTAFKMEMLGNAKTTAIIVSGVCGFISMIFSGVLTYFITTKFISE